MDVPLDAPKLPRELHLLLALCRASMDQDVGRRVKTLTCVPTNWETFLQLVDRHRVPGLVYRGMGKVDENGIPQHVHHNLKERYENNTRKALALAAELVRLFNLFEKNGVQTLPLKGPALAMQLYSELGLRHAGDLDLLVAPEQVEHAERLLLRQGYGRVYPDFLLSPRQQRVYTRLRHHFGYYSNERQIRLELHYRCLNDSYLFPLSMDQIWTPCESMTIGNTSVKTLTIQDTLLYLCAHGARHAWFRLFWLCDVAKILRKDRTIDWDIVIDRGERLGISRPLSEGLLLSHLLLGTSLPDPVRVYSEQDRTISWLVHTALRLMIKPTDVYERGFSAAKILRRMHYIGTQSGIRNRLLVPLKFVENVSTNPKDWSTVPLPDALFPLYYVVQPFMWFWRWIL